jgi:hypothetical protein
MIRAQTLNYGELTSCTNLTANFRPAAQKASPYARSPNANNEKDTPLKRDFGRFFFSLPVEEKNINTNVPCTRRIKLQLEYILMRSVMTIPKGELTVLASILSWNHTVRRHPLCLQRVLTRRMKRRGEKLKYNPYPLHYDQD